MYIFWFGLGLYLFIYLFSVMGANSGLVRARQDTPRPGKLAYGLDVCHQPYTLLV